MNMNITNNEKEPQLKQNFKLSKSNKIYFLVIAVLSVGFFIIMPEKTPYRTGESAGQLMFFFLIPSLFAWIVWRLSARKKKSGSLAFNVVLTLCLLGQIGRFGNNALQIQKIREIQMQNKNFKKEISKIEDPEEFDKAYNKYANSVTDGINNLSEICTGAEKKYYKIISEFVSESRSVVQKWNASYNSVMSPRILDYSLLNSDKEFDYQRNILRLYIEQSKIYNKFFANMVPNLKKRLKSVLEEKNEYARGTVKRITEKYLLKKPIFGPLMQAHIEYGNNMIKILDILQKNKDMWSYENDGLLFSINSMLSKYNGLIEVIGKNEATINTLTNKLVDGKSEDNGS